MSRAVLSRTDRVGACPALLEVEGLQVDLARPDGTARSIVRDVRFSIDESRVLALVGESGSGKSLTALSLVRLFGANGLDRRLAARGHAAFRIRGGQRINLLEISEDALVDLRGREIGLIAQDPMSALNPVMTIESQIVEPRCRHLGESRQAAAREALRLLADAGFESPERVAPRYPHQLSGGMRQRAMIAIALAAEPSLLIADEPTTALDVAVQIQLVETLRGLRDRHRLAMLFISHDLGIVSRIADDIAVMYCGSIVESGKAVDVLRAPAHPYTQALIESLPRMERMARLPRPIPDIPADPINPPSGCAFHPRCARARPGICDRVGPASGLSPSGAWHACHFPLLAGDRVDAGP